MPTCQRLLRRQATESDPVNPVCWLAAGGFATCARLIPVESTHLGEDWAGSGSNPRLEAAFVRRSFAGCFRGWQLAGVVRRGATRRRIHASRLCVLVSPLLQLDPPEGSGANRPPLPCAHTSGAKTRLPSGLPPAATGTHIRATGPRLPA